MFLFLFIAILHYYYLLHCPTISYKGAYDALSLSYTIFQALSLCMIFARNTCFPQEGVIKYMMTQAQNPPKLQNYWIWEHLPPPAQAVSSFKWAYPAAFSVSITGCIMVSLWFYNMVLKFRGMNWATWNVRNSKQLLPNLQQGPSLEDSYLRPDTIKPWSRKSTQTPVVGRYHRLLALMAIINSSICAQSNAFELSSTRESFKRLRRFRSYQGELQTERLSNLDKAMVQKHLRNSTDLFHQATHGNEHVFSAIVDSGCTHSTTNSFADVEPTTIRKLSVPLSVGGINGDIKVEYVGRARWETIDDYGNIIPFHDQVFINESIPYKLLSPQAFLAHHKDGTRTGKVKDHFRIYRD